MIDPTPREQAALRAAAPAAGEYVEGLGKSDLTLFTVEEFTALLGVIVTAYMEAKTRMDAEDTWDDVPF